MEVPQNPAGVFVPEEGYGPQRRDEFISIIESAPSVLRKTVSGLVGDQLDALYRNWSIRQIVHHLSDSHVHAYTRFKFALTEDCPTIKPYDESTWAATIDSRTGDIQVPLALIEGLHARWVQVLRSLTPEQFQRSFHHPEYNQTVRLSESLCLYAWHCRHHTAQIQWIRDQRGW
jgi:uncharacterized damage-inducible protein DinB